jgi:para-nitrobenzyl esterase
MNSHSSSLLAPLVLGLAFAPGLAAQAPPTATEPGAALLALATVPAKSPTKLTVTSPAFVAGGDIPFENTQYKGNVFPGLSWTAGPAGTKAYAVIMQDGDGVRNGAPYLHWTMIDVPASVTRLAAGMTTQPEGAIYGPNYKGDHQPFLGPRTPAGPKHRYHIQVFALDAVLPAEAAASYDAIIAAMKGHVLASGELVALGQFMPPASPSRP